MGWPWPHQVLSPCSVPAQAREGPAQAREVPAQAREVPAQAREVPAQAREVHNSYSFVTAQLSRSLSCAVGGGAGGIGGS